MKQNNLSFLIERRDIILIKHCILFLTTYYNQLVFITVGTLPQLIGFIRFGEPVPHGLSARHRVWAGPTKG